MRATGPYRIAIALLLIGNVVGCGGDKDKVKDKDDKKGGKVDDAPRATRAQAKEKAPPDQAPPAAKLVERKIVYTAALRLQVEDFVKAEEELLKLVDEHKGILEMSE